MSDSETPRSRAPRAARSPILAAILAGGAWLVGCGGPEPRYVDIDSKPTGAVIYVDGERRGLTRSKVRLDFDDAGERRVLIQIVKPRYKPVLQYWSVGEIPESGKKVFTLEVD